MNMLSVIQTATGDNTDATTAVDQGIKGQSSQALILQSYALALFQQAPLPLSTSSTLQPIEKSIADGIATAQGHAKQFIDVILPQMLTAVTDMNQYFNLQNALGQALNPGMNQTDTVQLLQSVLDQVTQYQTNAKSIQTSLATLASQISVDAGAFNGFVSQLNTAVDGDNGLLDSLHTQLDSIDKKIDGAIAGVALSGLAIAGGVFLIAIGAIADFVTAGTSTSVVVVGVGIVAAGIGGEVASAITLSKLIDLKGNLLGEESSLKAEVKAASGMRSHYTFLSSAASSAAQAAQQMANAWGLLGGHLQNLVGDVQSGAQNAGSLQTLFLTAAKGAVADVQSDLTIIEGQLTGINVHQSTPDAPLATQITTLAQAA